MREQGTRGSLTAWTIWGRSTGRPSRPGISGIRSPRTASRRSSWSMSPSHGSSSSRLASVIRRSGHPWVGSWRRGVTNLSSAWSEVGTI